MDCKDSKDYEWIRKQIDTFYYGETPVSTILQVSIHIEAKDKETATDDAKLAIVKQIDQSLRAGMSVTNPIEKQITIDFQQYPGSIGSRFWICREGWHEAVKSQYVSFVIDNVNKSIAKWFRQGITLDNVDWSRIKSAHVEFLISKPIDFKHMTAHVVT